MEVLDEEVVEVAPQSDGAAVEEAPYSLGAVAPGEEVVAAELPDCCLRCSIS